MRAAGCAAASAARDSRPSGPPAARRPRCPLHARARSAVSARQRAPLMARAIAVAAAAGVQPNDEDGAEAGDAERLGADFRRMQRLAAQAGACSWPAASEAPPPSPSQPVPPFWLRLTWRGAQTTPTRARTSRRHLRRVQAVRRSPRAARLATQTAEPRCVHSRARLRRASRRGCAVSRPGQAAASRARAKEAADRNRCALRGAAQRGVGRSCARALRSRDGHSCRAAVQPRALALETFGRQRNFSRLA